jgi:hypothetical protein
MQASALLVGSFVLVQTVLSEIPENTFAQQSFNGIESLIQSHNESDPYTIVELVPDASYAKLGYLVGGSEPFYLEGKTNADQTNEEYLAALTSPEERTAFFSQMEANLSSITSTETVEKPLAYAAYQESYVSQNGYTKLVLAQAETIAAGQRGYYMKDVGESQGDYRLSNSGAEQDTEELPDSDEKQGSNVIPESDPATGGAGAEDVGETETESGAASVEESEEEPSAASVEESEEEPSAASVEESEEEPGAASVEESEEEPGAASVEAAETESSPKQDASSDGTFYEYVGEGKGNFRLVADADKSLDYPAEVSAIYYTGGFTNNEWFKKYVFNRDADISISVVTLTPAQFAKYNGDMDLLYISGSSLLKTSEEQSAFYGENNDLSATLADEIYAKVVSESIYLPVIFDYAILQNDTIKNTYIYHLAQSLSAEDLTPDNYTHGYVSGNVYVIPCNSAESAASFLNEFGSVFLDCSNVSGNEFAAKAAAIGFGDVADTIISFRGDCRGVHHKLRLQARGI